MPGLKVEGNWVIPMTSSSLGWAADAGAAPIKNQNASAAAAPRCHCILWTALDRMGLGVIPFAQAATTAIWETRAIPSAVNFDLPPDLPRPEDDGLCDHLAGARMPAVSLSSTRRRTVNLGELSAPRTVIYCYPMTGALGTPLPDGWNEIPGARGCTPQARGFRDRHGEIVGRGAEVFGVSTQSTGYQSEMAERLHLPFEVLSDAGFELCEALRLPTFEASGMRLIKRLTLIVRGGAIETVFYPVFPPNENARQVVGWLGQNPL